MDSKKIDANFEIYEDQLSWMKEMVDKFDLPDAHKALRILVDYARTDGDLDDIFTNIRCTHCG